MRISQLAARSGVPATTLRFYESAGLIPAERTSSGYRDYREDVVERLAFIGVAKKLGLPLAEIGELLDVWQAGVCADVKADLRPRLAARLAEVDRRLAELSTLRAVLDRLDALPDRQDACDPACEAAVSDPVPIACSLTSGELDDRVGRWRVVLDGASRAELAGGVRLTAPVERAAEVAALAAAEQGCCPFFDFRLHFDGSALHVEVRAPGEARALLDDLFGAC